MDAKSVVDKSKKQNEVYDSVVAKKRKKDLKNDVTVPESTNLEKVKQDVEDQENNSNQIKKSKKDVENSNFRISLCEVLLILGLMGGMILLVFTSLKEMIEKNNVMQEAANLNDLNLSIQKLFHSEENYEGLSVELLKNAHSTPFVYIDDENVEENEMKTQLDTALKINLTEDKESFYFEYTDLNSKKCSNLTQILYSRVMYKTDKIEVKKGSEYFTPDMMKTKEDVSMKELLIKCGESNEKDLSIYISI